MTTPPTLRFSRIRNILDSFAIGVALLIALYFVSSITREILEVVYTVPIPFDTDEADHANPAWELFKAGESGSVEAIWAALTRQAFYPPLHSLPVAFMYWWMGPTLSAARVPSVLFYLLAIVSLFVAVLCATKRLGTVGLPAVVGGVISIILLASSPIVIANSGLSMLELQGVFLAAIMALCLSLYWVTAATLCVIALTLTKYSFGIFVGAGFFLWLWWEAVRFGLWRRAIRESLLFLVILLLWLCVTDTNSALGFITGHPSYSPMFSKENLLFEIRAWFAEYGAHPLLSALAGILAIYSLAARPTGNKDASHPIKGGAWIIATSFVVLLLSTTNESRHGMVIAPFIWWLSGIGFAHIDYRSSAVQYVSVVIIVTVSVYSYDSVARARALVVREMEGKPGYKALSDLIMRSINPMEPVLFICPFDQFGIEQLRWAGAVAANIAYTQVRFDTYPFRDDKDFTARRRKRNQDAPYTTEGFPRTPLSVVLAHKYYSSVVTIRRVGSRSACASSFEEIKSINKTPFVSQISDGLEIVVYRLHGEA